MVCAVAAVFAGCSDHDLVSETSGTNTREVPIEFNVQKQNITRAATNLEAVKHYNFGVWAWKVSSKDAVSLADAEVMNNYLVGWSNGTDKGYDKTNATTWAGDPGTVIDHTSPWFYEGLGKQEYTYEGNAGYYTKNDAAYMSKNDYQYLRYWDLAYQNTNFYCYAPYNANVTFTKGNATTDSKMEFPATAIRDGYDEPLNSAYNDYSRTLGEYMYAGVRATNSALSDVTIPFKHMGAQLFIRFYEDIPGYKVEIIDLAADKGIATLTEQQKGIQATPAIVPTTGTTYSNGTYYTTQGAEVTFVESTAAATYNAKWDGSTTKTNTSPLMFKIPTRGLSTAADAPDNLTYYPDANDNTGWSIIPEKTVDGNVTQKYSYSPTIYYPVAQPTTSTTGLTFHISYRIIAEDNKEVTTIHNATVHVPYKGKASATDGGTLVDDQFITVWQPNVKYTYTFKFTVNSTGTTDPAEDIDPTDPTPSDTKSMYPIVFDYATIDDYTLNFSEYIVSEGTNYNQTNP